MMVRTAKSCGDATTLWPTGIDRAVDVPCDLVAAIGHAQMILSWHENRPAKEIPPEWMWPFDGLLEDWFNKVDEERKDKSSSSSDDDSAPMMQNQLTKGRTGNGR